MSYLFWLTEEQHERMQPHSPMDWSQSRVEDRHPLSGIFHFNCENPLELRILMDDLPIADVSPNLKNRQETAQQMPTEVQPFVRLLAVLRA